VAGVAGLFTTEVYSRVKSRLAPGGVFAQWVQTYEISDELVLSVLSALHENFPSWEIFATSEKDILILASATKLPAPDWSVMQYPDVAYDLRYTWPVTPATLDRMRIATGESMAPLLRRLNNRNSDFFPTVDLNAERTRFMQASASGLLGLTTGINLPAMVRGSREGLGDPYAIIPGIRRLYSMSIGSAMRTGDARGGVDARVAATRAKAGARADALQSAEERDGAGEMAQQLSWALIHRLWQMLLKGLQDVQIAPDPREAAEMALLRLIHAADMPDPASLIAKLSGEGAVVVTSSVPAAKYSGPAARIPSDFEALVKLVEDNKKPLLAQQLHDLVGLVRFAPPELVLKPMRPLGPDFPRELALTLKSTTGISWQVSLSDENGEPSLLDQEKMAEERVRADVLADPTVRAVMDAFPDSELESFSTRGA
jgi:hypothetical protein